MKFEDSEIFSDEKDKFVAYIDNATIINACTILTSKEKFDIYKLLDLESFCEAILFYDVVRTLVGSSFSNGMLRRHSRYGESDFSKKNESSNFENIKDTYQLYNKLISERILNPVVQGAGTVHYYVENMGILDEIAAKIDTEKIVDTVKEIFRNNIPWNEKIEKDSNKNPWNIVIGEETWTSDSYPIYYFSVKNRKDKGPKDDNWGWEINKNRKTEWYEAFVSQTFNYVIEASLNNKPFICSSVRMPVVKELISDLNNQFFSIVNACLNSISIPAQKKVAKVVSFFGKGSYPFVTLPSLILVLNEAKNRKDFLPALFRIRQRKDVKEFRLWCNKLQMSWENENIDEVYNAINEVTQISKSLSSKSDSNLNRSLNHLGNVELLTTNGLNAFKKDEEAFVKNCFNPSLIFLTDIGQYSQAVKKNINLIKTKLEIEIEESDLKDLSKLSDSRNNLYSPGIIETDQEKIILNQKIDIIMGDKFENISNSTIISKSIVENSFNKVKKEFDEETAAVLAEIASIIQKEKNKEAGELFNEFNKELTKPEPKKSVLKSFWNGITSLLPMLSTTAGIVEKVIKIIG